MDNTLGCYSTKNNTSIQLSSDKCGSFIVNGESFLLRSRKAVCKLGNHKRRKLQSC